VALTTGCSTVSLPESAKLAKAGGAASSELQGYYVSSRTALPSILEMEVLRSSLEPGVSPPSTEMIASINRVELSLKHRARIASKLNSLYSSLHELSVTDYAGGVEKSIEGLNSEISGFASAINVQNPLSDSTSGMIGNIFGLLVQEQQKKRVAKANIIVVKQLEAIGFLLEKDSDAVRAIRRVTSTQTELTSIALWYTGTVSAKGMLSKYVASDGMQLVNNDTEFTSRNQKLRDAVPAIIRHRLSNIREAEDARYEAFGRAIEELTARHREIAEGAPADIASVIILAGNLNDLLAER
ncbi:unnamed protein product, partial [Ectocarpus sp. 12 AP-2014]